LYANRRVDGAEKETHVWRTLDLNQWPELMHFQSGLFLRLCIFLKDKKSINKKKILFFILKRIFVRSAAV